MQSHCGGRAHAAHLGTLARRIGHSETDPTGQRLRGEIKGLLDDHNIPIGSHPAIGYFLCNNTDDVTLATANWRSRSVKLLKRTRKLEFNYKISTEAGEQGVLGL